MNLAGCGYYNIIVFANCKYIIAASIFVSGQLDVMGTFHMLRWKFTHLDSNGDYMLQIRELHGFLKITKKAIHPKKCSRTFVTYCDRNGDRKVSIDEWYSCLGVKGNIGSFE